MPGRFNKISDTSTSEKYSDTESFRLLSRIMGQDRSTVGWLWDLQSGIFTVTDGFAALFHTDTGFIDGALNITQLLQPFLSNKDMSVFKENLLDLRNGTKSHIINERKVTTDEKEAVFIFSSYAFKIDDRTVRLGGTIYPKAGAESTDRVAEIARVIVDKTKFIILTLDDAFNVLDYNDVVPKTLLYTKAELSDELKIYRIDIENSRNTWLSHRESVGKGEAVKFTTSFQRSDSTVFPVNVTVFEHTDAAGKVLCLMAEDVSTQRLEDSELRPALAQHRMLTRKLKEERKYFRDSAAQAFNVKNIVTVSPKYKEVLEQVMQVAVTDATVLITGETGTGKELLAQAVHEASGRKNESLIKVNCANLPAELIESELFGHEKGAFTGATGQKAGRFELAHKGTILLDEIGEMPLTLQSRLLRILQEGEFQRVGGTKTIEIDVRVIAATNRNLEKMVEEGTFREDLYYRLCVFPIRNMPLRERKEDLEPLAYYFLQKFAKKMNRKTNTIAAKDLKRMQDYDFPGNIRELENIIERSVILSSGETLNLDFWTPVNKTVTEKNTKFLTLEEAQVKHITDALKMTRWKVSGPNGAAALLKINEQTLFSRMRKFGIER